MTCEEETVKDIYIIGDNLKTRFSKPTFSGAELVTWLLENDGQVETKEAGVELGKHLVDYRVIEHVDEKYHFLDDPDKIYRFSCDNQNRFYPKTKPEQQIWVQGLSVMRMFNLEESGVKKRRKSFMDWIGTVTHSTSSFKGKRLLEWLDSNTDFETLDNSKRFLKSLLKLNFIKSTVNDTRFNESGEYYFYLARLKQDTHKKKRLSVQTMIPERRTPDHVTTVQVTDLEDHIPIPRRSVAGSIGRKKSVIGLTPEVIHILNSHSRVEKKDQLARIKLRDSCVVLKPSLSRSSLNTSQTSLTNRDVLNPSSPRPSSVHVDSGPVFSEGDPNQEYLSRLKEQFCHNTTTTTSIARKRLSMSENSQLSGIAVSNLIRSKDFQKHLQNIGKSSSQKNLRQVDEERQFILDQLAQTKTRCRRQRLISPSTSCPNILESLLKRDYSTESHATKSSGYSTDMSHDNLMTSSRDDVTDASCDSLSCCSSSSRDSLSSSSTPKSQLCGTSEARVEEVTRMLANSTVQVQTAASARRARLTRTRAVSKDGQ